MTFTSYSITYEKPDDCYIHINLRGKMDDLEGIYNTIEKFVKEKQIQKLLGVLGKGDGR